MGSNNWPAKVVCPACGQEAKYIGEGRSSEIAFECYCNACGLHFDISTNRNAFDIAVKFTRHESGFIPSEPV